MSWDLQGWGSYLLILKVGDSNIGDHAVAKKQKPLSIPKFQGEHWDRLLRATHSFNKYCHVAKW